MVQEINPRLLSERSFLIFQYPEKSSQKDLGYTELYVPLLENLDISESQNAGLVNYDIIGRAGNLFAYTGAKSRNFKLKFNITLLHVVSELHSVGISNVFQSGFSVGLNTKQKRKLSFLDNKSRDGRPETVDIAKKQNNYFNDLYPLNLNAPTMSNEQKKALNLIMYWINIIRTSTLNNSRDTKLGPPIIRLNHGAMYNNVPCVCDDFSIKVDSKTTYDIKTLIPHVIEINMSLHENRVGDFTEYVPYDSISGDNTTGWDGFLNFGTMDPFNGVVGGLSNFNTLGSTEGP